MNYQIDRYSLDKQLIEKGRLYLIDDPKNKFKLIFKDSEIDVESINYDHPLLALENLRIKLEKKYNSLINCSGCRIDVAYRPTGGFGSYEIEMSKPATKRIALFEPTNKIELLSTVREQQSHYQEWLNSIKTRKPFWKKLFKK